MFIDTTNPTELTILDLVNRQTAIAKKCDECGGPLPMGEIVKHDCEEFRLSYYRRLERESRYQRSLEIFRFFQEFDNTNSDPSYLAQREHELQITEQDWRIYRAAKASKEISF